LNYKIANIVREFNVHHSYAMVYFDYRGRIVKKAKHFLPYVDVLTDKEEEVMLSSSDEMYDDNGIQAYFSPEKFSMRKSGENDLSEFYTFSQNWSEIICNQFGLDHHLERVIANISLEIELDDFENYPEFMKSIGFELNLPGEIQTLRYQFDSLITDEEEHAYSFSIKDSNKNSLPIVEIEIMTGIYAPEVGSDLDEDLFESLFKKLERQLVKLNLLKEL
jgi:hypothetical protein